MDRVGARGEGRGGREWGADLRASSVFPLLPRQTAQGQGLGQCSLGPASGISTPVSPSASLTTRCPQHSQAPAGQSQREAQAQL